MQIKSNTEKLVAEEETSKEESFFKEQSQIKNAIQQRIATYLNASKT